MAEDRSVPIVGIPCCVHVLRDHPFHIVGEKYIRAVSEGAGALPLLIPSLGSDIDMDRMLDRLDGLLITGSPSNVEPHHYGGNPSLAGTAHDPARDATTLPLIRRALERSVPLLALCRGIQELNVVLGGTLYQRVHEVPGRMDHRGGEGRPMDVLYGPAHSVSLMPGGLLAGLADGRTEVQVNSLHAQGIDRLGESLAVEAVAPDGQIEAVRVTSGAGFAVGVQWHPEWRFSENALSTSLFQAFGNAVRARQV